MSRKNPIRTKARPAYYGALYPMIVAVGRRHGYAVAIHGSARKDLDLIAVPWAQDASSPEVVAKAIADTVESDNWFGDVQGSTVPARKPHGRLVWTITLYGGAYIDLSVLTTTPTPEAP